MKHILLSATLLLASPALAAEPTFTLGEVNAAFAMGRLAGLSEALQANPDNQSMNAKVKAATQKPVEPPKPNAPRTP